MNEWDIKPSYAYDLACFCNLLTGQRQVIDKHPQGHAAFKDAIEAQPDLIDFAQEMLGRGWMVGNATASLLNLSETLEEGIDGICSILEKPDEHPIVEKYLVESGLRSETSDLLQNVLPRMAKMLRHFHEAGFHAYWQDKCLPDLKAKCQELSIETRQYPIISRVNQLLGHEKVRQSVVALYLCSFSAPYGIGLQDSFISDIRWSLEDTVSVAVHELIHPPFERETIGIMADRLWQDAFFRAAKDRLPASSGYPRPQDFLEENIVEGAHLFVCESMGACIKPLDYLLKHDHASHVVAVLVYDALRRGLREKTDSLEETIQQMIAAKDLVPNKIQENYLSIYNKAGLLDLVPEAYR